MTFPVTPESYLRMDVDVEDQLLWFLKWTLVFWLFPYIFWFFGRRLYEFVYEWVTEPADLPPSNLP